MSGRIIYVCVQTYPRNSDMNSDINKNDNVHRYEDFIYQSQNKRKLRGNYV
jgi:hypothetical protein